MIATERQANLKRIADLSCRLERLYGIPAEVPAGLCIIDSQWLAKAPDNNCFGLKAARGAAQVFPSLVVCFETYAGLLLTGRRFKARFARYTKHRDTARLFLEMSGSDGRRPYFTGAGRLDLWTMIIGRANVKAAIAASRAAIAERGISNV